MIKCKLGGGYNLIMFKAAIFDLDDTLYDYKKVNKIATENLVEFSSKRFNIAKDLFIETYNKAKEITKQNLGDCASQHNRIIYCQKTLELLNINALMYSMDMYNIYWDSILNNMKLNDGVIEILEFLKEKEIKVAICTDLTAYIQHRKIRQLGIDKYINFIVTSEEVGEEKPSPKMFKSCIDKFNLKPSQIFCVGDSYEKDILGSINLDIYPILYTKVKNDKKIFRCATIENFVELKNII